MNLGEEKLRIARTEALFRDVNERIAETADRFESSEASFVCECADAGCTQRVDVSLADYERVRAQPTTFVLAPGHEITEVEDVVADKPGYRIVEKVERVVRQHVTQLDPRAGTA
jgi:hypothetical protein